MRYLLSLLPFAFLGTADAAVRTLVVYCSHDPDACELAAKSFQRETGIETAIIRKPTGEYSAQIRALGGMALINGAPHPEEARAFYDWAVTQSAQELANRTRNLLVPAHARAEIRAEAAAFVKVRTLDIDPCKFGNPDERKRLLARWQKEIGDSLR